MPSAAASAGVTAPMNWPYTPLLVTLYVRALATSEVLVAVVICTAPPVLVMPKRLASTLSRTLTSPGAIDSGTAFASPLEG